MAYADRERSIRFEDILLLAPVLLFSIVAHEYAHGEAAYRQGDTTAYMLGRLTLNPLKHIDPVLTILLPIMLLSIGGPPFGGAKPVPVNPRNFKDYSAGDVVVSVAGILTNLVLFVLFMIAFALIGMLGRAVEPLTGTLAILQRMMGYGMWVNTSLAFFNFIPIPPLDGSHVLKHMLPPGAGMRFRQLYMVGVVPIMLVVWLLPGVVNAFMWPARELMDLADMLVGGLRI